MAYRSRQIQPDFVGAFEWSRPSANGPAVEPVWADLQGQRSLVWTIPKSAPGFESYRPLNDPGDLYLTFASIEPSEPTIVDFARRFGSLTAASLQQDGVRPTEIETIDLWRRSVSALRAAIELRQAIDQKNRRALSGWLFQQGETRPRVIFRRVFEGPLLTVEFVAVDTLWLQLVRGGMAHPLDLAALALNQLTTTNLQAHVDIALLRTTARHFHLTGRPRDFSARFGFSSLGPLKVGRSCASADIEIAIACSRSGAPARLRGAPSSAAQHTRPTNTMPGRRMPFDFRSKALVRARSPRKSTSPWTPFAAGFNLHEGESDMRAKGTGSVYRPGGTRFYWICTWQEESGTTRAVRANARATRRPS